MRHNLIWGIKLQKDIKMKHTDSLQAEESFYQAFQHQNISLMKDVWDKTGEVVCIHPSAQRICGYKLIIASWGKIFAAQDNISISVNEPVYQLMQDAAIHQVKEELYIDAQKVITVLATNVYQQTQDGWKMIVHHASPSLNVPGFKTTSKIH